MLFKKTYKLATMLAVMGALTGHAASDIDLNSIGYFSFTPLPAEFIRLPLSWRIQVMNQMALPYSVN